MTHGQLANADFFHFRKQLFQSLTAPLCPQLPSFKKWLEPSEVQSMLASTSLHEKDLSDNLHFKEFDGLIYYDYDDVIQLIHSIA
jgi:hypothetical protein